jgi:hypothetical protein
MYDQLDQRRKWTYMTNGDYYPNLNKANGGYTYKLVSFDADDPSVQVEGRIEMNAHIKKYVIGKAADCDNNVGLSQDAANNIYMMRLADMYFTYTEAIMGTNDQTTDSRALDMYNSVRARAGLASVSSVTFKDLLKERRREFLFESVNWFDILRYRYRSGDAAALDFVNTGYETGYNRCAMYIPKDWSISSDAELNDNNSYIIVDNKADGGQYDHIDLSASSFILPIPAAVSTSSPALAGDPVDFYAN